MHNTQLIYVCMILYKAASQPYEVSREIWTKLTYESMQLLHDL